MTKTKTISLTIIITMLISAFAMLGPAQVNAAKTIKTKAITIGVYNNGKLYDSKQFVSGKAISNNSQSKKNYSGATKTIKAITKKINKKKYTFAIQQNYNKYTVESGKKIESCNLNHYRVIKGSSSEKNCFYKALTPNISGFTKTVTASNKHKETSTSSISKKAVDPQKSGTILNETTFDRKSSQTANVKIKTLTKKKIIVIYTLKNIIKTCDFKVKTDTSSGKTTQYSTTGITNHIETITVKSTYTKK